jgi:hypothetical protein
MPNFLTIKVAESLNKDLTHHESCENQLYNENIITRNEKILTNPNKKSPKKENMYVCEKCNYSCKKHSDYRKHLKTNKHVMFSDLINSNLINSNLINSNLINSNLINSNLINSNLINSKLKSDNKKFICQCGKQYKHASTLSTHKKKCEFIINNNENINSTEKELQNTENNKNENQISTDLIMKLIKQNQELTTLLKEQHEQQHKDILDIIPKIGMTNSNNTNVTNNFNMNVFLNEKCKDALNISDFVNNLHLQLNDLDYGDCGMVDGLTKIIINGLKQLDITKRPIHCSDIKRKILYVKNEEGWTKENERREQIRKAIHTIGVNNLKQLAQWIEENPDCMEPNSKKNKEYEKILQHVMETESESNIKKVIQNIAENTTINKE